MKSFRRVLIPYSSAGLVGCQAEVTDIDLVCEQSKGDIRWPDKLSLPPQIRWQGNLGTFKGRPRYSYLVFVSRSMVEGGDTSHNLLAIQIYKIISMHTIKGTTSRRRLTVVHNPGIV